MASDSFEELSSLKVTQTEIVIFRIIIILEFLNNLNIILEFMNTLKKIIFEFFNTLKYYFGIRFWIF